MPSRLLVPMGNEERNFRCYYYEKVGFRGVEEKRSLEILLKGTPLEPQRLAQFCLRFPIPNMYRAQVWKVILGIHPKYAVNAEFVMRQRREQYEDMLHTVRVMRRASEHTPSSHLFLIMWLVSQAQLKLDTRAQLKEPENLLRLKIGESVLCLLDTDLDCYWVSSSLWALLAGGDPGGKKRQQFICLVEKEEPCFGDLLKDFDLSITPNNDPIWMPMMLAIVLQECSFEKLWDKIIAALVISCTQGCH